MSTGPETLAELRDRLAADVPAFALPRRLVRVAGLPADRRRQDRPPRAGRQLQVRPRGPELERCRHEHRRRAASDRRTVVGGRAPPDAARGSGAGAGRIGTGATSTTDSSSGRALLALVVSSGAAGRGQLRQRLLRRHPGNRRRSGRSRSGWSAPDWPAPARYARRPSAASRSPALAGLALVMLTGFWWLLGVGVACILAAWFYTGGRHPYGYLGLGELFVFVFFGLVAVGGTVYVQLGSAAADRAPRRASRSAPWPARSWWSTTFATWPAMRGPASAPWPPGSATGRPGSAT